MRACVRVCLLPWSLFAGMFMRELCACMCLCVCSCVRACLHTCARVYVCICAHACMYLYVYIRYKIGKIWCFMPVCLSNRVITRYHSRPVKRPNPTNIDEDFQGWVCASDSHDLRQTVQFMTVWILPLHHWMRWNRESLKFYGEMRPSYYVPRKATTMNFTVKDFKVIGTQLQISLSLHPRMTTITL